MGNALRGKLEYADNGVVYEGDLMNYKSQGKGKITCEAGIFEGDFSYNNKGERICIGTFKCVDGKIITGNFVDEKIVPECEYRVTVGDTIYCGHLDSDGKRSGQGTLKDPLWGEYAGQWRGDLRCGVGYMKYPASDENYVSYRGDWDNDKMDGEGRLEYPDKRVYTGSMKDNKINGYGTMKYVDGEGDGFESGICEYAGEYLDGRRTYGTATYVDGSKYIGGWDDLKMHGKDGQYIDSKGNKFYSDYNNGNRYLLEEINIEYENKDKYEGFIDATSRKSGKGTLTKASGEIFYCDSWLADKKHGFGTYSPANGLTYSYTWEDDKIVKDKSMEIKNGDTVIYEGGWEYGENEGEGHPLWYGKYCLNGTMQDGCWDNDSGYVIVSGVEYAWSNNEIVAISEIEKKNVTEPKKDIKRITASVPVTTQDQLYVANKTTVNIKAARPGGKGEKRGRGGGGCRPTNTNTPAVVQGNVSDTPAVVQGKKVSDAFDGAIAGVEDAKVTPHKDTPSQYPKRKEGRGKTVDV
jgi:hypothetical protein